MSDTQSDLATESGSQEPASAGTVWATPGESSRSRELPGLPILDWVLLPLVAFITLAAFAGGVKLIADREIGERKALASSACIQDLGSALHGVPNSVCSIRYGSGKTIEYRFNSCGHRTLLDCRQKPDGVYRIVLIGSSNPMGFGVSAQDSLAEQLSGDLYRLTGRRVEVYNAALLGSGGVPGTLARRMPEILGLQPDLILWVINSWDVSFRAGDDGEVPAKLLGKRSPLDSFGNSRAGFFLRSVLFQSQSIYMTAYLKRAETIAQANATVRNSDEDGFRTFSLNLGTIVDHAKVAGVPVAAAFLPIRGESDSIFMNPRPDVVDVDRFTEHLRATLAGKGVVYLDVVPRFLSEPGLDGLYDRIGDHLNAEGHAAYAQILANALTGGAISALSNNERARSEKMRFRRVTKRNGH